MEIFLLILWYVCGLAVVIYEFTAEQDVRLSHTVPVLILAVLGPLWLIRTMFRKTGDVVLFKKRAGKNNEIG